nr:immunoglobulin heavy chain junction region [Mus musculus]
CTRGDYYGSTYPFAYW